MSAYQSPKEITSNEEVMPERIVFAVAACYRQLWKLLEAAANETDLSTRAVMAAAAVVSENTAESCTEVLNKLLWMDVNCESYVQTLQIRELIQAVELNGGRNGLRFKEQAFKTIQVLIHHELSLIATKRIHLQLVRDVHGEIAAGRLIQFNGGPIERRYDKTASKWTKRFLFSKDFVYVVARQCHRYFAISRSLMQDVYNGLTSLERAAQRCIDDPRHRSQVQMSSVDRVLMGLWQLRNNVKYHVISEVFGISESAACNEVRHSFFD